MFATLYLMPHCYHPADYPVVDLRNFPRRIGIHPHTSISVLHSALCILDSLPLEDILHDLLILKNHGIAMQPYCLIFCFGSVQSVINDGSIQILRQMAPQLMLTASHQL